MKDFFNNEIKVGDYIAYPRKLGRSKIDYIIVKVIRINKETVTANEICYDKFLATVIKVPNRAIVISEELAFEKEPKFKNKLEQL